MQEPKLWHKEWVKAGGLLGVAILTARLTRTPLATIIATMPYLINLLRQAENRQQSAAGGVSPVMNREEAALILGVSQHASAEEVQRAHRRLIQKNHPDTGGTDYLAAKINQARDVLLK